MWREAGPCSYLHAIDSVPGGEPPWPFPGSWRRSKLQDRAQGLPAFPDLMGISPDSSALQAVGMTQAKRTLIESFDP